MFPSKNTVSPGSPTKGSAVRFSTVNKNLPPLSAPAHHYLPVNVASEEKEERPGPRASSPAKQKAFPPPKQSENETIAPKKDNPVVPKNDNPDAPKNDNPVAAKSNRPAVTVETQQKPVSTKRSESVSPRAVSPTRRVRKKKRQSMLGQFITSMSSLLSGKDWEAQVFVAGQKLVEKQTFFHDEHGNLFHSLIHKSVDEFKNSCYKECERDPKSLLYRDPVGACVFHIAYLHGRYDVGRWLIQTFPHHCIETYGKPNGYKDLLAFLPYTGENILHMVIVSRNLEETEFMLQFYKSHNVELLEKLLSDRTTGHFFQPNGSVGKYFGEVPLLFAVSSNGKQMVDLILKYSPKDALLKTVDSHGNNALHLCVLNNLQDMYVHIASKLSARELRQLELVLNEDDYSPFTLAAAEGNEMFKFLLDRRKTKLWSYGPITRILLDLDGLDMPHGTPIDIVNSDAYHTSVHSWLPQNPLSRYSNRKIDFGAIECICMQDKTDLLKLKEIQAIIDTKWDRVGYTHFQRRFVFYLCVTFLLSLIVWFYQYDEHETAKPMFLWCLFGIVFIILFWKFFCELPDMYEHGTGYWGHGRNGVRGAAQLDNICSTVEFVSFLLASIFKVLQFVEAMNYEKSDQAVRVFLSITVVTAWIYLYFFLLGTKYTGIFVVIVIQVLGADMPTFMSLFVIVLFGFGSAFAVLNSVDGAVSSGLVNLINNIWTLLVYTISGQNEGKGLFPYEHNHSPRWFYVGLVMLYNLAIVFLMFNLLIAMMSNTFSDLKGTAELIVYREKYNIMSSFEKGNSRNLLKYKRNLYGATIKDKESGVLKFCFQLEEEDKDWIKTGK